VPTTLWEIQNIYSTNKRKHVFCQITFKLKNHQLVSKTRLQRWSDIKLIRTLPGKSSITGAFFCWWARWILSVTAPVCSVAYQKMKEVKWNHVFGMSYSYHRKLRQIYTTKEANVPLSCVSKNKSQPMSLYRRC